MGESLDKISIIHHGLTKKITQAQVEMEKTTLENKKTRELIQNFYDKAKKLFEPETHRYEAAVEASLSKNYDEINREISKHTDRILQVNANKSKSLRLKKYLFLVGIVLARKSLCSMISITSFLGNLPPIRQKTYGPTRMFVMILCCLGKTEMLIVHIR